MALPFTIFLVTLITLLLAMAFSRTAVEVQLSDSTDASITALTIAQGGLSAFMGDTFSVRPVPGDSFRYNVVGGYAWVVPEEIQKPADTINNDIMYAVRSTAYVIHPNQGSTPQARRTITQIARWYYPPSAPSVPALITSINGIIRPGGGQFTVQATDQCGSGAPPLAQMLTTPALPAMDANSGTGPVSNPSPGAIAAASGVNWADVMGGNFTPDYTSIQLNDTTYSVQMITGNGTLSMPNNGSGILIVTGNLRVTGSGTPANDVTWDGIILVGGYLVSDADYFDLNGIMVTGLNESLPPFTAVAPDTVAGGAADADFLYNPCEVARALARMRGFIPLDGTWVDNWATY